MRGVWEQEMREPRPCQTDSSTSRAKKSVRSVLDQRALELAVAAAEPAAKFGKLGVKTIRDMLYFFPQRHLDYSKIKQIS